MLCKDCEFYHTKWNEQEKIIYGFCRKQNVMLLSYLRRASLKKFRDKHCPYQ